MLKTKFPETDRIMLGRGLLMNPALAEEIKEEVNAEAGPEINNETDAGERTDPKRLKAFHDRLYHDYSLVMSGDRNVLFKMKEFWAYAGNLFPEKEKLLKRIKKASRLCDYEQMVRELLAI